VSPEAHIRRADTLAARYPSATELLKAYARQISSWQPGPIAAPAKDGVSTVCPKCGHNPQTAALRQAGDGARRSLICGHCAHEWTYPRIQCPNCQEKTFESLPVYIAPDYSHLRVECCNTCMRYLICADLVKDPEAVPLVDDLAAIALHLWAGEHGYTKVDPHWFGMNI
jgi:FdhE protein